MKYKLNNYISTIYILFLFTLFPLILHNKLFDVTNTKQTVFVVITSVFALLCLLFYITNINNSKIPLNATDIFIIAFTLINIISYILSDYKSISFHGTDGRSIGLLLNVFMVIMYFIITRNSPIFRYIPIFVSIGSSLVSLIGILNFGGIDVFNVYKNMVSYHVNWFISTLGHCNIYSSFFSITLPVLLTVYIKSDDKKEQIYCFVGSLMSFMGLITGNSDSGYLTIIAISVFLFLTSKKYEHFQKLSIYFIAVFFLSKITGIIYTSINCSRHLDSITQALLFNNNLYYIIPVLLIFTLLCYSYKNKSGISFKLYKRITLSVIAVAVITAVIYILFNKSDFAFFNFNDYWGNNRGFIWKRGALLFKEHYSVVKKLFGCGPDCLRPYIDMYFSSEIISGGFEFYDNVHNEFLQYLLTLGIFGLTAYLGIIVCSVRHYIKTYTSDIYATSFFAAFMCYIIQSVVNINQAVTTPLYFVMIALLNTRTNKSTKAQ